MPIQNTNAKQELEKEIATDDPFLTEEATNGASIKHHHRHSCIPQAAAPANAMRR
jgi:hypothetical protein